MKIFAVSLLLVISNGVSADYYDPLDYQVFGTPAVKSDKAAIDDLISRFWLAWTSQDAKAVASVHTKDAEWTNAFGRGFRGSDTLEVFLETRLFPMFNKEVSQKEAKTYMPVSRRYLGPSSAVITGRIESDRGSSVGTSKRRIQFIFILQKVESEWKIANQVINDLRERRN